MHGVRRDARREAWRSAANPFAKHPHRRSNTLRDVEEGSRHNALHKVKSDGDYRAGSASQRAEELGASSRVPQSATTPHANSRLRSHEAGDDIEVPETTMSPRQSIADGPDAWDRVETNGVGHHQSPKPEHRDLSPVDEKTPNHVLVAQNSNNTTRKRGILGRLGLSKQESARESLGSDDQDRDNGKHKETPQFTIAGQTRATFGSWINILLICSPIGIALHFVHVKPAAVFVVNFIAIIPLAGLLSYATEEIALRTGEVLGGLLNATFGNAVELIVSIIALAQDQVIIVQTSLIGSMLSNLLLVMGMCFFFGGFNRIEQAFNITVAQTASSLLFLAVSALIIPTVFNEWASTGTTDKTSVTANLAQGVAPLSRGTAIILLFVYACYLFFQLKSHKDMYNAPSEKNAKRNMDKPKRRVKSLLPGKRGRAARKAGRNPSVTGSSTANGNDGARDDEPETPALSLWWAIGVLAASTALVAVNAEYLVDSINDITCESNKISKSFIGLILLPIVGNAAEHTTAVTVAIKDKMDLAIGVAVGSSMQIALLVLPLVVVLGWILGKNDMTLYFDGFQIAVLFVAVLLVNYLIQDGKSHWLEGILLFVLYLIIAIAAWFYPASESQNQCPDKNSQQKRAELASAMVAHAAGLFKPLVSS